MCKLNSPQPARPLRGGATFPGKRGREATFPGERGRDLSLYVRERAPHFDLRLDAADDLGREVRGRGVAAEVRGADAVRDGLERRLVDRSRGAPRVLPLHVAED